MTKKELLEILKFFDDDTEIIIFDSEHKSVSDVIGASQNGSALQLNSGNIELHRLASIAMNIVMDTSVPEYIENAEAYTELNASIAMYDMFRIDHYAKMLLDTAMDFVEEYHCLLSDKLSTVLGEYCC